MVQVKFASRVFQILKFQVENEYGSYPACDRAYMSWLTRTIKDGLQSDKIVYFTDDGGALSFLKCGVTPDAYPTVDFGAASCTAVNKSFAAQAQYNHGGPLANIEFYPG